MKRFNTRIFRVKVSKFILKLVVKYSPPCPAKDKAIKGLEQLKRNGF